MLCGPAGTADAAERELRIDRRSAVVRPGDRAQLVVRASRADTCELALSRAGAPAARSRVAFAQASTVAWSWTVPATARAARWNARVTCERARSPRLAVEVAAGGGGELRLVGRGGIAATVTRAAAGDGPSRTEVAQLIVSIGGVAGAVVGLFFVWRQLKLTRQEGQADRTAQLVDRYQRLEFTELWSRVGPGFLKADGARECLTRMRTFEDVPYGVSELAVKAIDEQGVTTRPEHSHATYAEVLYAANFHEEVGVLFNISAIDREQLIRHFGAVIVDHFTTAWWWIHWRRRNGLCAEEYGNGRALRWGRRGPARRLRGLTEAQSDAFEEWERMVRAIVALRSDLHPAEDPRDSEVWIVCMPPPDAPHDGERYARVSEELSCDIDALGELEARLQVDPAGKGPPVRTLDTLCVMRWHVYRAHAERLQRIAGALDGLSLAELERCAGIAVP